LRTFSALLFAIGEIVSPRLAEAQSRPGSQVGIAHIGALVVHAGTASVERSAEGVEGGMALDLGWIGTPRLRLEAELSLLRATLTEYVETLDSTFSGAFFDLTSSVGLVVLLRGPSARIAPYLSAGIGVHALSSAFGTFALDRRYNANPFGAHVGAGARLRLPGSGRTGLSFEARASTAANVSRTSARVGGLIFFGDLVRPGGRGR
jgi:hypothetical protein